MLPKAIEAKTKKSISKIIQGTFSEDDVELLLIRLREYSPTKSIFREISHFIAHHKRNSGFTFLSLYRVYCRMRAYGEFQYHQKQLDFNEPIEKWFYDFIIFQLDEIESHTFKKKYGFSRKQAKKEFKSFFTEKNGRYVCIKPSNQNLIDIINKASSFIKIQPLFSCEEIMKSFSDTLKTLGLIDNLYDIERQSKKIILCLLVLMHKREFHINNDVFGKMEIDFPTDGFGNLKTLELRGTIQVPNLTGIVVTLIETKLDFETWSEPELLIQRETSIKGHFWTVFDDSAEITINKNGKLIRL